MRPSLWRPVFRPLNPSAPASAPPFCARSVLSAQTHPVRNHLASPTSSFSTTARLEKRSKGKGNAPDPRVTAIRYHLQHPLTPRPLHFSRTRYLRHWTIHRAWMLFLRKRRRAEELELERQYESMRAACEHLRLMDDNGMTVPPSEAGGQGADPGTLGPRGKEVGRLYRGAMRKVGIWGSVPVEYARAQVDFPSREGWNHGWTR